MNVYALLGAVEIGLVYGLVAYGVFLSFRVLNFPDLTVDGSFPLGAAVTATLLVSGIDPWTATALAFAGGCLAGMTTAFLNVRFGILNLLASILTMIALYTINLRIMGAPNLPILNQETVMTPFEGMLDPLYLRPLVAFIFTGAALLLLYRLLSSELGLGLRATGANPRMAGANGISTSALIYLGMALSNGLVALSGSLFAQMNGFADQTLGIGTIIVGLASVIVGQVLLPLRGIFFALCACVLGSVVYRLAIALALDSEFVGLRASDLNLVTALLVTLALILPRLKRARKAKALAKA